MAETQLQHNDNDEIDIPSGHEPMQVIKTVELGDRDETVEPEGLDGPPKSIAARFKALLTREKKEKRDDAAEKAIETSKLSKKTTAENFRILNDFLGTIELQLDKVDVQNKTLLDQLNNLKENNESLLEQIQTLTENNNQLTEQFNNMKKREKIAKTLAIISAVLAIGLSAFNIFRLIISNLG